MLCPAMLLILALTAAAAPILRCRAFALAPQSGPTNWGPRRCDSNRPPRGGWPLEQSSRLWLLSRPSASSSSSALNAVTFRYSPSALDHLAALDDDRKKVAAADGNGGSEESSSSSSSPDDERGGGGWSETKIKAAIGSFVSASLAVGLGELVLPSENSGLAAIGGAAAAAAGWKAFGGDAVREEEMPKDGGYDAKFVVDKPGRVRCILDRVERENSDRKKGKKDPPTPFAVVVESNEGEGRDLGDAVRLIDSVHGEGYLDELREAVEDARVTDRVRRLHPVVMRTLIDKHSYDAAVNGVADWIDSVDAAMGNGNGGGDRTTPDEGSVVFAITRPPGHHACVSRGMGGCLLNGPAVAAFRALERGASRVAVLDVDAHHGNGIANCVQSESRVRYVSMHEEVIEKNWFKDEKRDAAKKERSVDPRGPGREDGGPLGNVRNVPLPRGTTWEGGYKAALIEEALPFLEEGGAPDVLVVAAGFDALAVDATSGLALKPDDFREVGTILREKYGNRVAFGLEGGYAWQGVNGELGEAVVRLMEPWAEGKNGEKNSFL